MSYEFAFLLLRKTLWPKAPLWKKGLVLTCGFRGTETIMVEKGWHGGRNRKPRSHFICTTGSRMGWRCREEGWWEGAVRKARLKSLSDIFPPARLYLPKRLHNFLKQCHQLGTKSNTWTCGGHSVFKPEGSTSDLFSSLYVRNSLV